MAQKLILFEDILNGAAIKSNKTLMAELGKLAEYVFGESGFSIEKAEKNRHENEGRLNALKSELLIHRQSNSGRDSAQLQQRAASGKNKLDAL